MTEELDAYWLKQISIPKVQGKFPKKKKKNQTVKEEMQLPTTWCTSA